MVLNYDLIMIIIYGVILISKYILIYQDSGIDFYAYIRKRKIIWNHFVIYPFTYNWEMLLFTFLLITALIIEMIA